VVTELPVLGQQLDLRPFDSVGPVTTVDELFCDGNTKLGQHVLTFSLPAVFTCTGSTGVCRTLCYVCRPASRFAGEHVRDRYWDNFNLSRRHDFADAVLAAYGRLKRKEVLTRLHVSGDFYDNRYASAWLRVMRESPSVSFWFYTRGWRDPSVRPAVEQMAQLPNVFAWYSCDMETGEPKGKPARVRTAYMMVHEVDVPSYPVDLYFRDRPVAGTVVKSIGGTLVCPAENGATQTTCERCRICLSEPSSVGPRRTRNRT
jgi:hypothetical protein